MRYLNRGTWTLAGPALLLAAGLAHAQLGGVGGAVGGIGGAAGQAAGGVAGQAGQAASGAAGQASQAAQSGVGQAIQGGQQGLQGAQQPIQGGQQGINRAGQNARQGVNRAGQTARQGTSRAAQTTRQGINRAGQATQQGGSRTNTGRGTSLSPTGPQGSARGATDRITDSTNRALDSTTDRTDRTFDRTTDFDRTDRAFDDASDRTDRAFDDTRDRVDRSFDDSRDRADRAFDDASDRVDRAFDDTRDRADRAFDDTRNRADRALDDTSDRVDRAVDDIRDRASRATDRAGRALDRGLDRAGRAVDRAVDRASGAFDRAGDTIDRTGRNIRGRLDDSIRDTRGRVGRSERLNWSDLGVAFGSQARGDLTVRSVTSESIFGRAGLRRGDEIVSIDGREFSSQAAALNYLNRLDANQTVDIVALRNGEYLNLDASLAGLRTGVAARTSARAYLGVTFDDQARDLRVYGIDRNSPAFRAGLRRGDQIVSINGREFDSYRDAVEFIQTRSPNEQLDMTILRNGREIELQANLAGTGQGTERLTARGSSFAQGGRAGLGVVFDQRSSDRILISEVAEGSPAEIAGLRQGDVILSVDGRRMSSFDEVSDYIGRRSPEEQVDIAVLRNGRRINLQAELASRQEVFDEDQGASRSFQRDTQRTRLGDRFVEEGFEQSERFPDVERDSGLPARVRESREAMRRRASDATGSLDGQGDARESIRERERNRGQDSAYGEGEIGDRASDPRRGSDDD